MRPIKMTLAMPLIGLGFGCMYLAYESATLSQAAARILKPWT